MSIRFIFPEQQQHMFELLISEVYPPYVYHTGAIRYINSLVHLEN
jgi:hypothetical protein